MQHLGSLIFLNFHFLYTVIEKKRNQDKPGPGMYLDRTNIDYFSNEIRFNNKFSNSRRSSFGGEKRFSFPSKCPQICFFLSDESDHCVFGFFFIIAAAAHKGPSPSYYAPKSYWKMDA